MLHNQTTKLQSLHFWNDTFASTINKVKEIKGKKPIGNYLIDLSQFYRFELDLVFLLQIKSALQVLD